MDSIYGGRPGAPFVIKGKFESVKDMQAAFQKGLSFKDVWIGEYCIIDTPNKNDWDNGKIYQRGPEWTREDGDARYVGQIVGPQSGVPNFEFGTLKDVQVYTDVDEQGNHIEPYPEVEQGKSGYQTRSWVYQEGTGEDAKEELFLDRAESDHSKHKNNNVKIKEMSVGTSSLVPGMETAKDGKKTYHDSIKYNWVNIAYPYGKGDSDSDLFASATTLVGFEIPYTVQEYHLTTKLPYKEKTENGVTTYPYDNSSSMDQDDSTKNRPFAYLWNLKIPMGIKGESVKKIYVGPQDNNAFLPSDIEVSSDEGKYIVTAEIQYSQKPPIWMFGPERFERKYEKELPEGWDHEGAQFWYCDFVHYASDRNGTEYKVILGAANEISDVKYDQSTGILTIVYTNKRSLERSIPAIEEFSFNDALGTWRVGFNNSAVKLNASNFSSDTTIKEGKTALGTIRLLRRMEYNYSTGKFNSYYTKANQNGGLKETADLPAINSFKFNDADGTWEVGFNNSAIGLNANNFSKDTTVTSSSAKGQIKFVNNISTVDFEDNNSDFDGTRIILSDTKGGEKTSTINGVLDLYSDLGPDKSNHLYALFSSKAARNDDKEDESGQFKKGFQSSRTKKNTTDLCWLDLGAIKDQSGVLIGHDLSKEEIPDKNKTTSDLLVKWLNENRKLTYENGVYSDKTGHGYEDGKLLTYINEDGVSWFFAWDYSQKPEDGELGYWYFVGQSFSNSSMKVFGTDWTLTDDGVKIPVPEGYKSGDLALVKYSYTVLTNRFQSSATKNWWEAEGA